VKRLSFFLALLLSLCFLAQPAFAGVESADPSVKIHDFAGLLTSEEQAKLERQAQDIVNRLDVDIAVVTVDGLDGLSPSTYANDFFELNGFGTNGGMDGMLLLVSMADRDYHIATSGKAYDLFYDKDLDEVIDRFLPYLSDGEYYTAFSRFLLASEAHLAGTSLRLRQIYPIPLIAGVAVLIGLVVAGIVMSILALLHKRSLAPAPDAAAYLTENGFRLTHKKDMFQHTYTSRTPIPKSNSGGGGGSGGRSSSSSSSGRSFGGRGGKF